MLVSLRRLLTFVYAFFCGAAPITFLTFITSAIACAQNTPSASACRTVDDLKTTKTVAGIYTDEARKKSAEGKVVMCVTVDGQGRVTGVNVLSGPPELFQQSIDAVKQWQFERPSKVPAVTTVEMAYSLSSPCPGGGKGSDVGEVKVDIGAGRRVEGEAGEPLKIVAKLYQPEPSYPEKARIERRRGQLYLSIVVNAKGEVVDAKIVRSLDELLDLPALDTIRTWRFKVTPGGKTTVFPVTLSFHIPCLDHQ